ncbi:hypothetical protein NUSPORA_02721 [Nucleospora cyclopteri]
MSDEKQTKYEELLHKISNNEAVNFKKLYIDSFVEIVKSVDDSEKLLGMVKNANKPYELTVIYLGALFYRNKYKEVFEFTSKINLTGEKRETDFYNAKMIKYYYYSCRALNRVNIDEFYNLLATNREYRNRNSVQVLVNIILSFNIEIKNYRYFGVEENLKVSSFETEMVEEKALYNFLMGHCFLVRGFYRKSLQFLDEAEILNNRRSMGRNIKKLTIVCKLLLGEKVNFIGKESQMEAYEMLIDAVEGGEPKRIAEILQENKIEFFQMDLYHVIKRLTSNALREGIRRISQCYTRIRVETISEILGMKVDFILMKALQEKQIDCKVESGILISIKSREKLTYDVYEQTRRVLSVREEINQLMEYPTVPVLNYERLMKEQQDFIDQYDI